MPTRLDFCGNVYRKELLFPVATNLLQDSIKQRIVLLCWAVQMLLELTNKNPFFWGNLRSQDALSMLTWMRLP